MVGTIKSFMNKYGSEIEILDNDSIKVVKGFLYPLYNKSKYFYKIKFLPTGRFDNSHYVLIAEPNPYFKKGKDLIIRCNGVKYSASSNGTYTVKNKKLYVWAVLTAYTAPREDDYGDNL